VAVSGQGRTEVRPADLTLACAAGNDALTGLSWTSWGPKLASGYGTPVQNDCRPYCAAGHFHSDPVLVVLWGTTARHGHPGTLRDKTVTLICTGARPQVYHGHSWVGGPATVTTPLWP
jgi:hypothetical protein